MNKERRVVGNNIAINDYDTISSQSGVIEMPTVNTHIKEERSKTFLNSPRRRVPQKHENTAAKILNIFPKTLDYGSGVEVY